MLSVAESTVPTTVNVFSNATVSFGGKAPEFHIHVAPGMEAVHAELVATGTAKPPPIVLVPSLTIVCERGVQPQSTVCANTGTEINSMAKTASNVMIHPVIVNVFVICWFPRLCNVMTSVS